ncbi:MAG: protein translocase subunit SecD [Silvanigrellales bacterium]|nr:protein translocase subunit SecD [Silvanigrellales bacterium]
MKGSFTNLPILWWVKAALTLLALLFGVLFTLPTFFGDPATWPRVEEGPDKGQPVGAFHRFVESTLPSSRINLGLDLKGGLHLLFEVDVEQSVKDSLSRAMSRARDLADKDGIKTSDVKVAADYTTTVVLADPSKKEAFAKHVTDQTYLLAAGDVTGNVFSFSPSRTRIDEYEAQILTQAINTIRNRIDQFGVAEPNIFQQGASRIVVQLPGSQDLERAKQLIGNTAQLDFRMVLGDVPQVELDGLLKEARTALSVPEDDTTPAAVRKLSEWLREQKKIPTTATVMLQRNFEKEGVTSKLVGTVPYLVEAQAKLTGDLLDSASAEQSAENFIPQTVVAMNFGPQGGKLFGDLTTEASKKAPNQIAIILDDNINSAPSVNGPILGGKATITMGRRSSPEVQAQEAQDLALVLRSGALPAAVKVVEERQVGPSEGAENIRKGVVSSGIAAVIVVVFMLFVYGVSGMVANVAMLLNVLLILAFMAAFGATLTLPGIAGIVLTMAVAVDGNVIINERIREEVRAGNTSKVAFYKGYNHSFGTLVDAHITSAVAAFVLLLYGNPAVKGFAVTLMVGIVATLFTSYYVTEVIGQWLVEKTRIRRFM